MKMTQFLFGGAARAASSSSDAGTVSRNSPSGGGGLSENIAQVESDLLKTKSDFGMEMEKSDGDWKIVGLNFSKMLAEYAAAADVGKVPYTPIAKNPQGGESLVLYFEYDVAGIEARTFLQ